MAKEIKKKSALGMGIEALIPDKLEGDFFLCPIEDIRPSKSQPRKKFDHESIDELAESIKSKGLIQPIVVRKLDSGEEGYELIAGERRWRAAQKAGLSELPAILRESGAEEVLELALIENIQRENLNPVDEARGFKLLMDASDLTHEALSKLVGKSRTAVTNTLRLLSLEPAVLDALRDGKITAGHARALLGAPMGRQVKLLAEIVAKELSVRQTEALVSRPLKDKPAKSQDKSADIKAVEERLMRALGTRVALSAGKKKGTGTILINFASFDDLDRILALVEK